MITYVANADNYKQKYEDLKSDRDGLSKKADGLAEQLNAKIEEKQQAEDKLNGEVASLKAEVTKLQGILSSVEREKASLLQKVNSWTSVVEGFTQTNDAQGQLLKNTLEELNKVKAEQIKERKELNETTAALVEKMAIIETLQTGNKRLVEEKSELQGRLDQFLLPMGKVPAAAVPVTPEAAAAARPAVPVTEDIALKGVVTAVDLKNSMASISLGASDGVKTGMRFHVTRGNEFLCDILIIDTDSEEAVGVLELVQQQPKVGDNVSTNL